MRQQLGLTLLIVLAIAGLDQISKNLIVRSLVEGERIPVIEGLFNITLSYNRGAAFGILADIENNSVRIGLLWGATVFALVAVSFMYFVEYRDSRSGQVALALILGGAFGNIIDRVSLGEVVDFLDFYYSSLHWPAFNIADSSICIGVALLLVPKFAWWTNRNNETKGSNQINLSVESQEAIESQGNSVANDSPSSPPLAAEKSDPQNGDMLERKKSQAEETPTASEGS